LRHRLAGGLIAAAIVLLLPAAATAITIENYEKWRASNKTLMATPKTLLGVRLLGIFQGLQVGNRALRDRKQPPLFCVPAGAQVTGADIAKLVDQELKAPTTRNGQPYNPKLEISVVVAVAAARRWPCAN